MEFAFVGRTVNVAARVQTLTRIHQADILVTEAQSAEFDARFVLMPMPAEFVKGIAEPEGNQCLPSEFAGSGTAQNFL